MKKNTLSLPKGNSLDARQLIITVSIAGIVPMSVLFLMSMQKSISNSFKLKHKVEKPIIFYKSNYYLTK